MSIQVLLLDDVEELGRSGDVVNVSRGYARNFLYGQKKAIRADKHALRMQARLRDEREKRAEIDRKEAEEVVAKSSGLSLRTVVKVDPEGHMYGSVSAMDLVVLLAEKGIQLNRKNIILPHPIKTLGEHQLRAKLKEGVVLSFLLIVESDIPLPKSGQEKVAEVVEETEG